MLKRALALGLLVLAACSESSSGSGTAVPAAARPAAVAGNDMEVVLPSYSTDFATAAGWTLDAAVGGVGSAGDGARQVSLVGASFAADAPAAWTLTSVKKYNTLACSQCHPVAGPPEPFRMSARADYDGDIAVNLLQSSCNAVTGASIGAPFVPFP